MSNYDSRVIKIQKHLYPDLELSRDDWKYGDIPDKYGSTDVRYDKIFTCKLQTGYKCDLCNKEYNNSISYYNKEINQHRCLNCITDNARYDDYDVFFVTDSIDQSVVPRINKIFKENMTRINKDDIELKFSKCKLEKRSKFFFTVKEGEGHVYCFMCYLHMLSSDVSESQPVTNPPNKFPVRVKNSPKKSPKKSKKSKKSLRKSGIKTKKSLRGVDNSIYFNYL